MVEHRAFDLLPQLSVPTLVMNQQEGRVVDSTKRVADAIPDCRYLELPGSSEGVMDDPAAFSHAVIEFLAAG